MYNNLSKRKIFLLSAGIVLFCYCFAMRYGAMTYHTNDDVAWQNMISQFTFDGLWWHPPFPSILLTYPIGMLCYFIPEVPWWYVISQLLVASGILITHYVILRLGQIKKVPFWLIILLLGIFDAVYNVICIAEIAWTIVPAVTGSGIISLAFYYPHVQKTRQKWIVVWMLIGTIVALSHRRQTAIVVLAFLLLSVTYILSQKYGFLSAKMIVRTIGTSLVLGALILSITLLNRQISPIAQGEEWISFSSARSAFIDFTHDSYQNNPEIYEAVGWSEDTQRFAETWNFLSDEITRESFNYISENSTNSPANLPIRQRLINMLQNIEKNTWTKNILITTSIIIFMSLCWIAYEHDRKTVLFAVLNGLAVLIAMAYLGLVNGRVIFRTVFIILYPGVLVSLFFLITSYKEQGKTKGNISFLCCAIITIIIGILFYEIVDVMNENRKRYERFEHNQIVLEKYLHDNPEKVYIIQGFNKISYKRYSVEPERNSFGTGGTMWMSNWWKHLIEENELETINWHIFERPDVYYLGGLNNKSTKEVLNYLQREFDCKGIAVIEPLENYIGTSYCMKFVYEDNELEYDSYYSVVNGELIEIKTSESP